MDFLINLVVFLCCLGMAIVQYYNGQLLWGFLWSLLTGACVYAFWYDFRKSKWFTYLLNKWLSKWQQRK
jgi:hypothetical protein